jgi:hypothetical protein
LGLFKVVGKDVVSSTLGIVMATCRTTAGLLRSFAPRKDRAYRIDAGETNTGFLRAILQKRTGTIAVINIFPRSFIIILFYSLSFKTYDIDDGVLEMFVISVTEIWITGYYCRKLFFTESINSLFCS